MNLCLRVHVFLTIRRPPRSTRTDTLLPYTRASDRFGGILSHEHIGITQRMFNLRVMTHPLQVFRAVVVLDVIDVDDKIVIRAGPFDKVFGDKAVQIIILPIGFTADGDTWISLREPGSQHIADRKSTRLNSSH